MPKETREPILHGRNDRPSNDLQGEGRGRKAEDFKMNDQKTAFLTASFNLWKEVKITRVMRSVSDKPSL